MSLARATLGYMGQGLNDTSMGLNNPSMGPKTPQWGPEEHENGHKVVKSVVIQIHFDVAKINVKKILPRLRRQ